jgi:predicted metal-dependent phosphoesterase TrpH
MEEKFIDLHTHSTMSDGSMTPVEVVRHAKAQGLAAIALTDHDSIDGVREAMAEGERIGIEVVPAIEFSVKAKTEMHILGYYIDINNPELLEQLEMIKKVRKQRTAETCQKLNDLGFAVTVEEALAIAPAGIVGRAHFAKLLADKGYTASVKEGFELYLNNGKPAYSSTQFLSRIDAVKLIKEAGGLSFVAHLNQCRFTDDYMIKILAQLEWNGLDGIEGYYTEYTPELQEKYQGMAKLLGLAISGGTDFHAEMKPHIQIGKGLGNLKIPTSVLENIKALRKK